MRLLRLTQIASAVLLISFVIFGCKKNLSDMTDGMIFSLDMNSFLQNQVQVQIVNANYENSTTLPNAKISILGKDVEKVVDINGSKNIVVEDQFANLAVSPGNPLTEGNQVRFTLRAEAPGFLPMEQEILVTHLDSFMNYTLEMIEIANPPSGISISNNTIGFTGKQEKATIFNKGSSNFSSKLLIAENTKLIDDAGNTFLGNAEIRLHQFDAAIEPVKANIPNLISNFSYTTFYNGVAEEFNFQPIAYLRLEIDNNTGRKIQFDQPAEVEISLSSALRDPINDQPLQAGDKLTIYQKNNSKMGWEMKNEVILTADQNKQLKANFTIVGTDEIALSRSRGNRNERAKACANNLGIRFKRNSNVNTLHYITVVNADKPNLIYLTASNIAVANNSTYNFNSRLPENVNVKVLVYQFETASGKGQVVGQSDRFLSCSRNTSNRIEILVNPIQVTQNPIARFELFTICRESKLAYFHEGRIQFRPAGSRAPYRDMGLAQKTTINQIEINTKRIRGSGITGSNNYSYLETDRMVNNTTYQFKTEIIGKRKSDGRTIRKTYTRNRVFNLNEFTADSETTPINYNFYIMNRYAWIAPEDACEDFGY